MTLPDLTEKLMTAYSGYSFSLWSGDPPFPPEADPSAIRHVLFGYTVCWSTSNTSPCPTEEEITAYQNQF